MFLALKCPFRRSKKTIIFPKYSNFGNWPISDTQNRYENIAFKSYFNNGEIIALTQILIENSITIMERMSLSKSIQNGLQR